MSRTHTRYRRRKPSTPKLRGVSVITWGEAMDRVAECSCPAVVSPGAVMLVRHQHRHSCPALERRWPQ